MNVPQLNPDELPASRIVPQDVLYDRLQRHTRVVRGHVVVDVDAASPPSVKDQGRHASGGTHPEARPTSGSAAPSALPTFTPPHDDEDDLRDQYERIRAELFLENEAEETHRQMPNRAGSGPERGSESMLAPAPREPPAPTWMGTLRNYDPRPPPPSTPSQLAARGSRSLLQSRSVSGLASPAGSPTHTPPRTLSRLRLKLCHVGARPRRGQTLPPPAAASALLRDEIFLAPPATNAAAATAITTATTEAWMVEHAWPHQGHGKAATPSCMYAPSGAPSSYMHAPSGALEPLLMPTEPTTEMHGSMEMHASRELAAHVAWSRQVPTALILTGP